MAVVMRGWSRTASTALKLATAERIIGYQFKDIDKLYEALDQTERTISLPSGKKAQLRPRNSRLALVGDALGKLYMAQGWYNTTLTGGEWNQIHRSTLSNDRLGGVGFKLGLDECAISKKIVKLYDMATTLEAIAAAVHMDGASQEQCHKVYTRFGLEHKLLDPPERLWIWKMVSSRLDLPEKFFIGHHFKLQEGIFQTQLKHFPAQKKKKEAGLWGRAKWLWWRAKRLWQPRKETRKKRISERRLQQSVSRSSRQPPGSVDSLAERTQSAGTRTKNPPLDVATSETEVIGENSAGRCEDVEQTAAPERTADERDLAKKREAEESTSAAPTSSKPTKRPRRPAPSKEDTSTDDVRPAETGSENSSTDSRDRPAPKTSSKDVAATGVDMKVENQPHETLKADPVEAIKEVDSEQGRKRLAEELAAEAKILEAACRKLRLAGGPKTEEGKQKLKDMQHRRKLVVDKRSVLLQPLNRQS